MNLNETSLVGLVRASRNSKFIDFERERSYRERQIVPVFRKDDEESIRRFYFRLETLERARGTRAGCTDPTPISVFQTFINGIDARQPRVNALATITAGNPRYLMMGDYVQLHNDVVGYLNTIPPE